MELKINYEWCREHCQLPLRGYGVTPPPFRSHLFEHSEAELRAMAYYHLDLAALPWLEADSAEAQRREAGRYIRESRVRQDERASAMLRRGVAR